MKARALIGSASYDPNTLKVLDKAFDDAWDQVRPQVSTRPEAIDAARMKLAESSSVSARNGPSCIGDHGYRRASDAGAASEDDPIVVRQPRLPLRSESASPEGKGEASGLTDGGRSVADAHRWGLCAARTPKAPIGSARKQGRVRLTSLEASRPPDDAPSLGRIVRFFRLGLGRGVRISQSSEKLFHLAW